MKKKALVALGGTIISLMVATGVVMAQSPSPSPSNTASPSPSASPRVPSAAPSTGMGGN